MIADETYDADREIDLLSTLLRVVTRFRWFLVAAVAAGALSGFLFASLQRTVYSASARVFLSSDTLLGGRSNVTDADVRVEAAILDSTLVAERASEILGGGATPGTVRASVVTIATVELDAIIVRAERPFPGEAARYANAVTSAYEALKLEELVESTTQALAELTATSDRLESRVSQLDVALEADPDDAGLQAQLASAMTQLRTIGERIDELSLAQALGDTGVELVEPALQPSSALSKNELQSTAAGAIVLLLLALGVAWWRTERSPEAWSRHDPARILGAPLLGEVPRFAIAGADGPLPAATAANSVATEGYEFVMSSIRFALMEHNGDAAMLAVTSVGVGDGKTVTAANLAVVAMRDGRRPLLVDADERARGLSQLAGMTHDPGITDLVLGNGSALEDTVQRWDAGMNNVLSVVPAGEPVEYGTAGLFRHAEFAKVMLGIREQADLTLVDVPPVSVAETLDIVAQADGVLLVVRPSTSISKLREARDRLAMTGTPLIGYVYNGSGTRSARYGSSVAYGYGLR